MSRKVIFTCFLLLVASICAAAGSYVSSLNITVRLQPNGDAVVSEKWAIDVDDKISEWYLVMDNMGERKIENLSVCDETTTFENEGKWNVDRSRAKKAGKCGIVYKSGNSYEVCWGVGSSGPHTYTATYTVTNLVQAYADTVCGFHHQFVAYDLGSAPQEATITIEREGVPFSLENAKIWAFHFYGDINFEDGKIVARTTEPLTASCAMTVMCQFEGSAFDCAISNSKPFAKIKEKAMRGSDYTSGSDSSDVSDGLAIFFLIGVLDVCLAVVLFFLGVIIPPLRKKFFIAGTCVLSLLIFYPIFKYFNIRKYLKKDNDYTWYREIPFNRNLRTNLHVFNKLHYYSYDDRPLLIEAYILRLLNAGALTIRQYSNSKGEIKSYLHIEPDADFDNLVERKIELKLYDILKDAAGEDGILQEKELKKYCSLHSEKVSRWYESLTLPTNSLKSYPRTDVQRCYGLYNFLKDFSLIDERGAMEVTLWDEYLVMATIFGIADKVRKDFKEICPEYFQLTKCCAHLDSAMDITSLNYTINHMSRYIHTHTHSAYSSEQAKAMASSSGSSGGGGRASFGGGGGFSGGGYGGGGR
ncbi:MAG: DUF2207 domain-containing protein [Bacteroidales bacterium]|nr:DUF2207 domain-containing protein [Bacteroidales bacterium]